MNSNTHNNTNLSFNDQEDVETIKNLFQEFLHNFTDESNNKFYHLEAENMCNNKRSTLYVDVKHIFRKNFDLVEPLLQNYHRYEPALRKAVQNFMFSHDSEFANQKIFNVGFYNLYETDTVRALKTSKLGKLIALKGTVTKTTEVRPELVIGKFTCSVCGAGCGLVDQQFRFTSPKICPSKNCNNCVDFELNREESLYVDWQKIKLQETAFDLPSGAMPRSIEVVLRNEQVERAQPGDRVVLVGTLVVVPDAYSLLKPGERYEVAKSAILAKDQNTTGMAGVTGLKELGVRDLNHRMVFLANNVVVNEGKLEGDKDGAPDEKVGFSEEEREEFAEISRTPNLFEKLTTLIAPAVLGNTEIKKGLLLMLFGGVNKGTPEGMKLRGDINVCLVGDPSTAKSQFLKFIHNFIPRTVYTSGRGSTAAGLTASLNRDPETGEFTIEAGALLLADNGICCIDEFDKMNDHDVVAIHEAMEQQTISLTKAGIQASLNARASILAALNPILGRYDKTKTLRFNVNLAPPLMSRFDLFFVLIDECDETIDTLLAEKIVNLHAEARENIVEEPTQSMNIGRFKRYLRFAKKLNPQITPEAAVELKNAYVKMRMEEMNVQKSSYRITVRQLESLIRLSEAIAKLHCSLSVTPEYVKEARVLLSDSIMKIYKPNYEMEIDNFIDFLGDDMKTKEENLQKKSLGSGSKKKKATTVSITSEEYDRISRTLIFLLREHGSVDKDFLLLEFINNDMNNVTTSEDLTKRQKLVRAILNRMIKHEKTFIEYEENDGENSIKKISFHPRYQDN